MPRSTRSSWPFDVTMSGYAGGPRDPGAADERQPPSLPTFWCAGVHRGGRRWRTGAAPSEPCPALPARCHPQVDDPAGADDEPPLGEQSRRRIGHPGIFRRQHGGVGHRHVLAHQPVARRRRRQRIDRWCAGRPTAAGACRRLRSVGRRRAVLARVTCRRAGGQDQRQAQEAPPGRSAWSGCPSPGSGRAGAGGGQVAPAWPLTRIFIAGGRIRRDPGQRGSAADPTTARGASTRRGGPTER